MTWIKFPCNYHSDPRMFKLRAALGDDVARSIIPRLWTFAAEQKTGDLSSYPNVALAETLSFKGDADKLMRALLDADYLDKKKRIPEWGELFGLPDSRHKSAAKAAAARWAPRTPHSGEKRGEEKEERRGEAHALRDALRDASAPPPTVASLLTPEVRSALKTKLRIADDGLTALCEAFDVRKRGFPLDPRTGEALEDWTHFADGKAALTAARKLSPTRTAPATVSIPEPAGWREWARENMTDPSNADRQWPSFDRSEQTYICEQMAAAPKL